MIIYADFDFYKTQYLCGAKEKITFTDFNFYARKATLEIDRQTFNRIPKDNISENVKMCCCEVAEILYQNKDVNISVSSESLGDQSTTFYSLEEREKATKNSIKKAVSSWLISSGYLFRGV